MDRSGAARLVVALPITLLLLATPASAHPAHKNKEPCDLLKRSEIEDVVGVDLAEPDDLGRGETCFWFEAGTDSGGVALTLDRGRGAKSRFRDAEEVKRDPVEIEGLGKDAYFIFNELGVLKSKKTAFYLLGPVQVADLRAPLEALAQRVLERL
jgi:hypothetical protein